MAVIDVVIKDAAWSAFKDVESQVKQAGLAAVDASNVPVRGDAEIAVMLADDGMVRKLNAQWRAKDKPTNVLSFPAVPLARIANAPMLGDIIIARETVLREAQDEQKEPADHLQHLVVHGVLHLLGYDHETDDDAEKMEALERAILAGLGIADPYADAPLARSMIS